MAIQTRLEQAPVAGPGYLVRTLPALVGRDARLWMSFRVSLVMDLLSMAAQASVFFFLGMAMSAGGRRGLQTELAAFLAVGLVFNAVLEASLSGPYQSLAMNYWYQRLESLLLSPCPVSLVVIADVGWAYVRAAIKATILAVVGLLFGARVSAGAPGLLLTFLVLALGAVAVLGFGLMSAAMFMLINAKGWNDPVAWLVGVLQGLVTGAYFPVSVLPGPLHVLAMGLPQTYTIDAARRLLLPGTDLSPLFRQGVISPIQLDLVVLLASAVVLQLLGWLLFGMGLRKAQADGGLSRWA
jgi:ABC-2 type transport system permease protein